jgi:hypothetical protein
MKTRILATLLIAASASIAAPAFASGYGPAPFYHPSTGAPASQRGQSGQTVAAEQGDASASVNASYGGVASGSSQSGGREAVQPQSARRLYEGH